MGNNQFNNGNSDLSVRSGDRSGNLNNMNDFCRRRNFQDFDGRNCETSNTSNSSNYRNTNSRSDDTNFNQQSNNLQPNRGPPTDSFNSDNAQDEEFFRPTKVIDYSSNSKQTSQNAANNDSIKPVKVVDYGHQPLGIVSRPQSALRPRPTQKYAGEEFFPVKTIDYQHSSNKHMIKEYYYSIVSKWNPTSNISKSSSPAAPFPNKSVNDSEPPIQRISSAQSVRTNKPRELKEITYEQLSAINTKTKQGKRMKRALIMKVSAFYVFTLWLTYCAG